MRIVFNPTKKGVITVKLQRLKTYPKVKPKVPQLRFTPTAWAKLLYLRDWGDTEVGAFGICPQESLLVQDIRLVQQTCTYTTVAFEDGAVADFFDEQVDAGRSPEQFARVWIHTHPGSCPQPSLTDENTFARVFGQANWAVMFILACGGQTYTRLRFNGDPAAEMLLETAIDYRHEFGGSDFESWEQEYLEFVNPVDPFHLETNQGPRTHVAYKPASPHPKRSTNGRRQ